MCDDDHSAFVPGSVLRGSAGTAPEGRLFRKFNFTDELTLTSAQEQGE